MLTDRDVGLIEALLDLRTAFIARLMAVGAARHEITGMLDANELSFRRIAEKFDISKSHVADIASGRRRSCRE